MIIIEKCNILTNGMLVILTGNTGRKQSFTRLTSKDEFQRVGTLVSPAETHDKGWERKEL